MTSRERKAEFTARTRKIVELIPNLQYAIQGPRYARGVHTQPYIVHRDTEDQPFQCPCPSFERDGDCKHVAAVSYFREGGDTSGYPELDPSKRPYYPWDNRRRKTARRIQERFLLMLLVDLLMLLPIGSIPLGRPGRPYTDIRTIIFSVVLRIQHHKSGDLVQPYIEEAHKAGLLPGVRVPSVEALTSNMRRPRTLKAMYRAIRITADAVREIHEPAAMDGSEFNIPILDTARKRAPHLTAEQHRKFQIKTLKAHILVGIKSQMVLGVRVSNGKRHDSKKAIAIMSDALRSKRIPEVIADKAYLMSSLLQWANEKGITYTVPAKSNTTDDASTVLGNHARNWWAKSPQERAYGRRQVVEGAHSADKRLNSENLRSKQPISQAVELLGHVLTQNLRKLVWLYLDESISDIPFMSDRCRKALKNVRSQLKGLPRPDLSPRHRDGLDNKAA